VLSLETVETVIVKDEEAEKKKLLDQILLEMERFRERALQNKHETYDCAIRVCEAIVAEKAGYHDRAQWIQLQRIG
jgi:hypothetical protein